MSTMTAFEFHQRLDIALDCLEFEKLRAVRREVASARNCAVELVKYWTTGAKTPNESFFGEILGQFRDALEKHCKTESERANALK